MQSKRNYTSNIHQSVRAKEELTEDELNRGCMLGIDSWADTCCSGRHCIVESYIDGKTVTANGFSNDLPSISNLPIANVKYAYDSPNGTTYILRVNNSIHLGSKMDHSLLCPNQCRSNGILINTIPSCFSDDEHAQTVQIPQGNDGIIIPIQHYGPLPFIPVRRPTNEEIITCEEFCLTPEEDWEPYNQPAIEHSDQSYYATINIVNNAIDDEDMLHPDPAIITDDMLLGNNIEMYLEEARMINDSEINASINKIATSRKDTLNADQLAKLWNIGLRTAKRTITATSHQCLRTTGKLTRRFRTDKAHMRYRRLSTKKGLFYVDTLKSKVKSIRGYNVGNLYTNKLGFRKFFPMEKESETPSTLQYFIELVGLPPAIHSDNAKVFMHGTFSKLCRKFQIKQTFTEPYSPWQNRAETGIKEVKSYGRKIMESKQAPIRLWCFAFEYAADILTLMATGTYQLGGRTPYEIVMGYTPDISEYVTFEWYQWAYYWDEISKEKKLCRWLGVSHNVGQSMCYWILIKGAKFITRSTVIPIPDEDLTNESLLIRMNKFTESIEDTIGDHEEAIVNGESIDDKSKYANSFYMDEDEDDITYPWDDELADLPLHEEDDDTMSQLDEYIGTHIKLHDDNGIPVLARVKGRKRDQNGMVIGKRNNNPMLDSRIYKVEFPDGRTDEYATNAIAEALYADVDDHGFNTELLEEICDHDRDSTAIAIEDGYVTRNGTTKPVITTKGWRVKVRWSDNSYDWLPMTQIKNSNPVMMAEYALAKGLHKEPAFNWWVNKTLKKRMRLISKFKTRIRKPKMKFGIIIPTNMKEAEDEDRKNGNTYWADAVTKEMENNKCAFEFIDDDDLVPPGYKEIKCHMNFEVKFDLRRKARYVAGGHLTDTPTHMTYSSVVSRESVRIAFLIAALNDLDVLACDIQNAYLNAPTEEKLWFKAGSEFGANKDKKVLIVRALYGLKGSGKAWRYHLADKLQNVMGFKSSLADPDVWYKPMTKPNGHKYYCYLLVYVDDVLIIDDNPDIFMKQIQSLYQVKSDSIKPPDIYIGANIQKIPARIGGECWGLSAEQYVRDSVKNFKMRLKDSDLEFNKKLSSVEYSPKQPFSSQNYRPELDTSTPCDNEQATLYQNIIGTLRWIIELGRIDIGFETSCLSQYLVYPRIGHLNQALHVIKYLDIHRENFLSFDPTRLNLEEPLDITQSNEFKAKEMRDFYPDAEESLPANAPQPRGEPVQLNVFVDADHAGNQVTRRSHTGIILFLNMAPIYWYSKRQNTVESSTFSSEFVALKTAVELVIAMRYKLRMMGVPIDGAARIFCDNEAVYKNASFAASTLKKKHNSVAYHRIRECVAAGICYVIKEGTNSNLADILTKSLPPNKRKFLRERIMVNAKVKGLKKD